MELGGRVQQHDGYFFDYQYPSCNLGSMVNVNVLSSKKTTQRPRNRLHELTGKWCCFGMASADEPSEGVVLKHSSSQQPTETRTKCVNRSQRSSARFGSS